MTDDEREVSDQVLAARLAATVPRLLEIQREQAQLIRELRRRKWSQGRIAIILGMSQQAVSKRMNRPQDDTTE
ncbi:hypothetical protein [Streptosporangium sp. NPDC051022]|uniref:hypothetical protein n=1 Tax=Streptosporangium sp. NPDC051022 TaxID=3155752 RepID=UPI003435763B